MLQTTAVESIFDCIRELRHNVASVVEPVPDKSGDVNGSTQRLSYVNESRLLAD